MSAQAGTALVAEELVATPGEPRRSGGRGFWREPGFAVITIILAAAIGVFIVAPIGAVLARSVGIGGGGLTLSHYADFFDRYYLTAYGNSIKAALLSTAIVVVLGVFVSLYVTRGRALGGRVLSGVALLPLVAPPFVFSLALIILFGRRGLATGWINSTFDLDVSIYGFSGVVLAQVLGNFPVAYMLIETTMRSLNPALEAASQDLGASQARTLWRVTLPLSKIGITKAALLVFVMAIADFSNPLVIGGNTLFLASETYLLVVGQFNFELAAVASVFLIIPGAIIFILQTYVMKGDVTSIDTDSGAGHNPLTGWVKGLVAGVSWVFGGFILLMFAMVGVGAFVKIPGVNNTLTLEHFGGSASTTALTNSIVVSLIAAALAAALGMLQGFLFVRKPIPGKQGLEFLTLFGLAVPGTAMGIGYVILFGGAPFYWTGAISLIILNMTFRKIGVGMQAAIAKMHQIDASMEEASADLGVGPYRTFARVLVPVMMPSFVAGFVYAFMTAMVSVSAVIFLVAPGTELAATYILTLAESAKVGMASAVSVVLILIVLASLGLLKIIERRFGVKI